MIKKIGDYEVEKGIGSGRFADAHLVRKPGDPEPKVLRLLKQDQLHQRDDFLHEATILKLLEGDTDKIAYLLGQGEFQGLPYLVTEYLHPDDYEQLHKMTVSDEERGLEIFAQFAELLSVAHNLHIAYCDAKADHLFWHKTDEKLRVIDWNLALSWNQDKQRLSSEQEKAMKEAFAQDLQEFGEMMFSTFKRKPGIKPSLQRLPVLVEDLPWPIKRDEWPNLTEGTKAIIEWLYSGGYDSAAEAEQDLTKHLDYLHASKAEGPADGEAPWLAQARERRREEVQNWIVLGRAAGRNRKLAAERFRRAWANIDRKRVELKLDDEPRTKEVFLRILQSEAMSRGGAKAGDLIEGIDAWLDIDYEMAIAALKRAAGHRHTSLLLKKVMAEARERSRKLGEACDEAENYASEGRFAEARQLLEQAHSEDETNLNLKQKIEELDHIVSLLKKAWASPPRSSIEESIGQASEIFRQVVVQNGETKFLRRLRPRCGVLVGIIRKATKARRERQYLDACELQKTAVKRFDSLLRLCEKAVGPSKPAIALQTKMTEQYEALQNMELLVNGAGGAIELRETRDFDGAREKLDSARDLCRQHWGDDEHPALEKEIALLDKEIHLTEARDKFRVRQFDRAIELMQEAIKCDFGAGGADQEVLRKELMKWESAKDSWAFVDRAKRALQVGRHQAAGDYLETAKELDEAKFHGAEIALLNAIRRISSELEGTSE